jgi:hypothetical protein
MNTLVLPPPSPSVSLYYPKAAEYRLRRTTQKTGDQSFRQGNRKMRQK